MCLACNQIYNNNYKYSRGTRRLELVFLALKFFFPTRCDTFHMPYCPNHILTQALNNYDYCSWLCLLLLLLITFTIFFFFSCVKSERWICDKQILTAFPDLSNTLQWPFTVFLSKQTQISSWFLPDEDHGIWLKALKRIYIVRNIDP